MLDPINQSQSALHRSAALLCVQRDPDYLPVPVNVHRLLLTGIMLAAKLTDDHYYNNAYYARVRVPAMHAPE